MILHCLILFISLLFIHINADVNKAQHLILAVAEQKANDIAATEQPSTEKTLIRYGRIL